MPVNVTTPPTAEAHQHSGLRHWYHQKRLGQRLTEQLTEVLNKELEQVFGYHMLVTGADIGLEFSRIGKTQRLFRLLSRRDADQASPSVIGQSCELPFDSDSLDALVLCHTLDTSPIPHQVLRECQRVLVPNGHLFVINFNPSSLWGIGHWMRRLLTRRGRRLVTVTSRRLGDWLSLLGFSYSEPQYLANLTPLGQGRTGRIMDRVDKWLVRHNMPTGTVYLLHARKRVAGHLNHAAPISERPKLISIPLGKSQEGIPVPRRVTHGHPDGAENPS